MYLKPGVGRLRVGGGSGWRGRPWPRAPPTGYRYPAGRGVRSLNHLAFEDLTWDYRTFNYDTDVKRALEKVGPLLDRSR